MAILNNQRVYYIYIYIYYIILYYIILYYIIFIYIMLYDIYIYYIILYYIILYYILLNYVILYYILLYYIIYIILFYIIFDRVVISTCPHRLRGQMGAHVMWRLMEPYFSIVSVNQQFMPLAAGFQPPEENVLGDHCKICKENQLPAVPSHFPKWNPSPGDPKWETQNVSPL